MTDYKVTDVELTSIANAIRIKGGTSAQLEFPLEFISAISAISGGGDRDVIISDAAPSASVGNDGDIYIRYAEQATDITSTGTQYIDTGILGNISDIKIKLRFKLPSTPQTPCCLFSSQWSSSGILCYYDFTNQRIQYNIGSVITYVALTPDTNWHELEVTSSYVKLDGVTTQISGTPSSVPSKHIVVWYTGDVSTATSARPGIFTLNYMQIYSGSTLVSDLSPAKDSNDIACLYDAVASDYLYNGGSGDFSYTPGDNIAIAVKCKDNGTWYDIIGSSIDIL